MSQKKQWSASAKFEIALLALKSEMTLSELCQRYQVAPSLVHAWKKQLLEQGSKVFAKNDKVAETAARVLEEKQSELYEKIGQLTVERDFLKKVWGKFHGNSDEKQ